MTIQPRRRTSMIQEHLLVATTALFGLFAATCAVFGVLFLLGQMP